LICGANATTYIDPPVSLVRNTGGVWSCGKQNISVTYKSGWTLDVVGDTQPVPDDVIQLANATAWLLFTGIDSFGKSQASSGGVAITLDGGLPDQEAATLAALTVL
jgi:hypothetical protein